MEQFSDVTSYYGQVVELDTQGRLTIAEWLRNKFGLKGEVAVIGKLNHIEIRVMEDFSRAVEANPLTPEDLTSCCGRGTSWWTPVWSLKAGKAL